MAEVENVDYKGLYNKVLSGSSSVDEHTLSMLIARYPYSQPLRYIQVQRQFRTDNHDTDLDVALLYAGSENWLQHFLNAGEIDKPLQLDSDIAPETAETESVEQPIPEHPAAMDYFAYEKRQDRRTRGRTEIVPLAEATPNEKVSLYHDEHMPYSFLWWLNKTRMEHAHTYQPYAPLKRRSQEGIAPGELKLDEAQLLDQQIRENIFHLQSPEEKLSEEHQTKTVRFQIPKKTDPAIERFIREEPQIKPPQPDKIDTENKARKSAEDQLTLVTETLARIYAEQGLYPKAIAAYKKLSLKYPEKSGYFAAQISELENKLK